MPSRMVVTGAPEISMASACETSSGVRPSARGAVLIDHELEIGRLLVPVELDFLDVRLVRTTCAPCTDVAHLVGVGADHANWTKTDRRTEIEAVDADARFAQRAIGYRTFDLRLDAFARTRRPWRRSRSRQRLRSVSCG